MLGGEAIGCQPSRLFIIEVALGPAPSGAIEAKGVIIKGTEPSREIVMRHIEANHKIRSEQTTQKPKRSGNISAYAPTAPTRPLTRNRSFSAENKVAR